MKKLYLFFALLLSLFGATTAFAQEEVTIQVNIDNGQWTVCNAGKTWATQWSTYSQDPLLTLTSHPSSGGGTAATDARGYSFNGNNNMNYYDGTNIKFFNSPYNDNGGHKYEVTVSSGYFIKSIDFDFCCESANGLSVVMNDAEEGVSSAGPDDVQHVSYVNEADDDEIFTVPFIVMRPNNENTFARTTNFVVVVKKQPEAKAALQELQATLSNYEGYVGTFVAGTKPGQYGVEEVAAFEAAITEAHASEDNPDLDDMPDAEKAAFYRALAAKIVSTYEAVLASKVPYTLADGYYRIKSGLAFYQTVTVTDPETEEETTTTTYYDKYLSTQKNGETISAVWNTPDDVATYCPALFQVTNKDGGFDIRSMATDGRFNNDKPVTLTVNGTNLMALDPVATTDDDVTYVNIRQASVAANSGQIYLHCGSHASGAGVSGTLTLWYSTYENETPYASEWVFVPVSDEEAQAIIEAYEPIKEQEMLVYNFTTTLADAKEKLAIARDLTDEVDTESPLISDAAQLSSPCSDSVEGQNIENLLDGDPTTIWHSDWHNAYSGTHYLQVEISDADVTAAALWFKRRNTTANQITQWTVYGYDNPEAEDGEGEELGILNTPYTAAAEEILSEAFPLNGHKYLRFFFTGNTANKVFAHFAEFQLYKAEIIQSPTAQSIVMGEVFTNLEAQVKALAGVEAEDVTLEQYRTLKAAYDAFIAVFVDPAPLRETLAELASTVDAIVVGTNPGFWSADNGAGAFRTLYDEAVAYDKAGAYTAEKSQGYIDNLNKQAEDILASANKIQTGKWYRIRFASEAEFDQYGWDKVAGNAQETGGIETSEALFGKYITVDKLSTSTDSYTDDDGESHEVTIYSTLREDPDYLGMGDRLYFVDKEYINEGDDLDLFRFIAVGDSAYLLQNKGTNLFLKAAGTSGAVTLSAHPSLFNVRAIGYGENVIAAKSITGEIQNNLHGQVAANMLVTWDASTPGSRSGLYIEEVSDVAGDYEGKEFNVPVVWGGMYTFCYPIEVNAAEGGDGQMWSVSAIDTEKNSVSLVKVEKAVAGRPFIYVFGKTAEYDAEKENEMAKFVHNYTIDVTEPQTSGLLKGTFTATPIDRGDLYVSGNQFVASKVSKTDVMTGPTTIGANHAYISAESKFSTSANIEIIWDENGEDGIQTALSNVSKSGAVYTIDGRLVSKSATLNDLQKFGKGLYILNGTKVVVK